MPLKLVRRPNFKSRRKKIGNAKQKFLRDLGNDYRKEHKKIVADWENQPTFFVRLKKFSVEVGVLNDKAGKIWRWVNFGTGERGGGTAYKIKPKRRGGYLTFRLGYVPKTTKKSHGGPGKATGGYRRVQEVNAKGIAPRRFDKRVVKIVLAGRGKKLFVNMRKAIFRR